MELASLRIPGDNLQNSLSTPVLLIMYARECGIYKGLLTNRRYIHVEASY